MISKTLAGVVVVSACGATAYERRISRQIARVRVKLDALDAEKCGIFDGMIANNKSAVDSRRVDEIEVECQQLIEEGRRLEERLTRFLAYFTFGYRISDQPPSMR